MADKETRKNLASTNQIFPFSYWLCESRTGSDFFVLALFSGIIVFQLLIQVKLNLQYSVYNVIVNKQCRISYDRRFEYKKGDAHRPGSLAIWE